MSDPRSIPDLVDGSGCFPPGPARTGLRLWTQRRRVRSQLEREIRAQIERLLSAGLRCGHVDGHHHLHGHPVVFEVLYPLLAEYGIGAVRLMEEDAVGAVPGVGSASPAGLFAGVVPAVHSALSRHHRRRHGSGTPGLPVGRVYGLRASGAVQEAYLLALIPRLRATRVEIYCHPGRGAGGGREREALCSPRVRDAITAAGYRLGRSGDRGETRAGEGDRG